MSLSIDPRNILPAGATLGDQLTWNGTNWVAQVPVGSDDRFIVKTVRTPKASGPASMFGITVPYTSQTAVNFTPYINITVTNTDTVHTLHGMPLIHNHYYYSRNASPDPFLNMSMEFSINMGVPISLGSPVLGLHPTPNTQRVYHESRAYDTVIIAAGGSVTFNMRWNYFSVLGGRTGLDIQGSQEFSWVGVAST